MRLESGVSIRVRTPNSELATQDYDLFDFDSCARVRQLLPDGFGLFFRDAFLHGLRRSFDEVLGFFQTKRSHFADNLDHVDLVPAYGLQDYVNLGLFFSHRRRFPTAAAGCWSRN